MTTKPTSSLPSLSSVKSPSLNDGHDQAVAKELRTRYTAAQKGLRTVVAFGLLAWEVKELRLKHGQFGPWLAAHVPELTTPDSATGKPKPSRALSGYMELTKGVLDASGFTVEKYLAHISNSQQMRICHGGKYLLLPDKKLPDAVRPLKEKICSLIDGKTQRQLFMEFKQAEEDQATGQISPKRGRLKGQGGATKAQREAAQQTAESARLEALDLRAAEISEWLLEVADDQHLGMISDLTKQQLLAACETAAAYLRRQKTARSVLECGAPAPLFPSSRATL